MDSRTSTQIRATKAPFALDACGQPIRALSSTRPAYYCPTTTRSNYEYSTVPVHVSIGILLRIATNIETRIWMVSVRWKPIKTHAKRDFNYSSFFVLSFFLSTSHRCTYFTRKKMHALFSHHELWGRLDKNKHTHHGSIMFDTWSYNGYNYWPSALQWFINHRHTKYQHLIPKLSHYRRLESTWHFSYTHPEKLTSTLGSSSKKHYLLPEKLTLTSIKYSFAVPISLSKKKVVQEQLIDMI